MQQGTTEDTAMSGSVGVNPARVRNHNERALLSLMRAHGPIAGSEVARHLSVSAQTASVLLRKLEEAGLVIKGSPIKGKVGKPQMPFKLNPHGAYSLGLKLGRRNADLILMDFSGGISARMESAYAFPKPDHIEAFIEDAIPKLLTQAGIGTARLTGMGVAAPFELWNWLDALGAPSCEAERWRDYDLGRSLGQIVDLPVYVANDVNMACNAELVFGAGRNLRHFAYFYISSFVGGGIVLDGKVFHGPRGNGAAFGSIPVRDTSNAQHQLIHTASLYKLEQAISENYGRSVNLRKEPEVIEKETNLCAAWRNVAAQALATAITSTTAVLDIEATIIDGVFPVEMRDALISETRDALGRVDRQGLNAITLAPGSLGEDAGPLGAAYEPLLQAHFLEGSALT